MMGDYSCSSIYKIYCRDIRVPDFYIGSTKCIQNRINCHYNSYNNPKSKRFNLKLYNFIRDHGEWGEWVIEEIYSFSCNNRKELPEKEQEFITKLKPSLNVNSANKETKNKECTVIDNYIEEEPAVKRRERRRIVWDESGEIRIEDSITGERIMCTRSDEREE
jgi:hypothetical protein